ncbi:MAG: NAD-dependent epimerase/dehydratase family protein [Lachnospiraceae bacterium]|nr:NAD-dependent epimerase/dehydratase family protein [Lachnospiraceae bacterium]MDE7183374.1 NAD-dependent epimerase/dehydratase family protein [Lachnospiraceae bacterium]
MRKLLVTGGTVFVSRFIAEYFAQKGDEVSVLNRNQHPQPSQTTLIEADRHHVGDILKQQSFDAVLDVTAYTGKDVNDLLDGMGTLNRQFQDYVLISSGAVYPETLPPPFLETQQTGENKYWGVYGVNKIQAETALLNKVPDAYILRPPYLYGPMNNIYREAFVFDCADGGRTFYLPGSGRMKLQFFHVRDLCRCIEAILELHPSERIYNVGNEECVSVREWVKLCYRAAGRTVEFAQVHQDINQREYFCFHDYEYQLDVTRQRTLISDTIPLEEGLLESYLWYQEHKEEVNRKGYMAYIDERLCCT